MTKKPIAWIVDSTAFIPDTLKNHPDFYSIPLNIHFGEKQYRDGIDLTNDELYENIKNAEEFPKTSQPSAGEFAEKFKEIAKDYEQAFAVHLSSALSGTLASSMAGAEIADFPVTFVDSLSLSYGVTGLMEKAMKMYEEGATVEDIKERLDSMAGKVNNYILMGQLEQLYKGGRMSGVQFFLGSLLKVKPVIQISSEGKLEATDKVRSEKKALQYLVDKVADGFPSGEGKIHLMQGHVPEQAKLLEQMILEKVPNLEIVTGDVSSTLAVHAGEGTLAVLWYDE